MKPIYVRKGNYGFSTKLKNEYNGQTSEMYMDVQFAKSNTPENSCKIEILDSFLTCYTGKNGVKPKLVVTNYRIVEESANNAQYQDVKTEKSNDDDWLNEKSIEADEIELDDDSLPF